MNDAVAGTDVEINDFGIGDTIGILVFVTISIVSNLDVAVANLKDSVY